MKILLDRLWEIKEELFNILGLVFAMGMFYLGPFVCTSLAFFLLFTPFLPLLLLYFVWIYLDRKTPHREGRRIDWVIASFDNFFQRFRNYFPIKVIKTADLPSTKNYIFGLFPHGILGIGAHGLLLGRNPEFERLYPGIKPQGHTLNMNFNSPFSREYVLSLGYRSVSKEALQNALTKGTGRASVLVIGGSAEALHCKPGVHKVVLKDRKGFIKLAITTGVDLVPVYVFGENEVYDQYTFPKDSFIHKIQQKFRQLTGVAPTLINGRGVFQRFFGILPRKKPIFIVVGKAIPVKKSEKPSLADIEALHNLFIQELTNLFDKHKHDYLSEPEKTFLSIF